MKHFFIVVYLFCGVLFLIAFDLFGISKEIKSNLFMFLAVIIPILFFILFVKYKEVLKKTIDLQDKFIESLKEDNEFIKFSEEEVRKIQEQLALCKSCNEDLKTQLGELSYLYQKQNFKNSNNRFRAGSTGEIPEGVEHPIGALK